MKTTSKFTVIEGSPLVGITLGEMARKFGVYVLHFCNPWFDPQLELIYNPERKIEDYFSIKVLGEEENISKLRKFSVDYKKVEA